jgi:ethanolamine phosphate transferase 2 subunit G
MLFWIIIGCFVFIKIVGKVKWNSQKFDSTAIFFLISMLLHQPQNIILPISCALTCTFLNEACNRMMKDVKERTIVKIFLHFWTGKLFYFYQGNSNSLSTIDVNAGFVGQMHVHLPIIFVFSTINTFNGQLISLYQLLKHLKKDSERLSQYHETLSIKQLLFKWLLILNLIPTTVFLVIITILRHHLFIWSVFSPKLLYDSFVSILICFVMIIFNFTIESS